MTEERLKELDNLASEIIVTKSELRNAVNEIAYAYRTLQQQNEALAQLIENTIMALVVKDERGSAVALQNHLNAIQGVIVTQK